MSQTQDILAVLQGGDWKTVRQIHAQAGYSRLNSRISELRKQGYEIECRRIPTKQSVDAYQYRLLDGGGGRAYDRVLVTYTAEPTQLTIG